MKVLQIVDSPKWAISALSKAIVRENPQMDIQTIYVHPRDAEQPDEIQRVKNELAEFNPDIIHFAYWNTAQKLIKNIPELREKQTMLTHHNQKNILSEDWKALRIKKHIVHTEKNKESLLNAGYENVSIIQHGIDLRFFEYQDNLANGERSFGYVGRIVPWKGLKDIARAARETGFPLIVMGKMDKMDYWESMPEHDRANMRLEWLDCKDSERIEAYYDMRVFVCNSGDNHEEGPLPVLEAMACGVPVITTPCGEMADICKDGENALVVPFGDYDALKKAMLRLITDDELANRLRANAWKTVKLMSEKKMALEYRRAYKKLYYQKSPLISVIIPYTAEREKYLDEIKTAYANQTYPAIEVIAINDVEDGYNLAKVRNIAAIEADGEYLLFADSRFVPEPDAVEKFVEKSEDHDKTQKIWYFGNKGNDKSDFVENFSFIRRKHYLLMGGCNERIVRYGAMSQELRDRYGFAGFKFVFAPMSKARAICSSHKTKQRRQDIIESKFLMYKMRSI